jgi:general secretion pathway protein L
MPADRDLTASTPMRRPRAGGRGAGLADFMRWWSGELAPLVPRATRAAVKRRRMRPVVAFDGDEATLWQPMVRNGEIAIERIAELSLDADAASVASGGRAMIDRIRAGATIPRITLAIPGRQTLRKTLKLPAALEENLKQALAYDLDRHTPFKADELYFDAAVAGRDAARGEIRVDLAAARRNVVDQALQHVQSWGAQAVAVVPDPPSVAGASRLNLIPEALRPAHAGWRRWQLWIPIVLLAAAAAAAIAIPLWQKREHAIALNKEADAARAQAAVSEGLRAELTRLTGDYNFALERKFAFPATVQVLDEITKLLPDDTWLTQMELKTVSRAKEAPHRELLLRGESANAGRLITLFEESKVFTQAAPRSPTTKIQPGPGEIFDLVAQIRPLPLPAPVDASTLPPPAEVPAKPPPAPQDQQASPPPAGPSAPPAKPAPAAPQDPSKAAKP